MSEFIFLTNQYLPKPGATGLCVHQLAKALVEKGHSVFTVCYSDGDNVKEYDGVNVIKINIPSFLKDSQSASDLNRKYKYCLSLWSKLIHLRQYPLRSNYLVNQYVDAIQKLLQKNKKVTIVASYTPIEAVIATAKVKEKYPKLVRTAYYSADTLSNEQGDDGILSASYRSKSGTRWEKKLFESFDKIFIMECHKEHYYTNLYDEFQSKFELVNFPLLTGEKGTSIINNVKGKKIRLVYAGTLYKKLRNPEFMNKLLIQVLKLIDAEAIFLGGGDCEDIMHDAEIESNKKINYIGMQPHSIAKEQIKSADILLSIGNIESPMAPSKIYEYMSTGKPIIHVYTYDKDPCIEPLKKYGNALLIREGEVNGRLKMLEFIKNRRLLSYEEVERQFRSSTPKYTADILEKLGSIEMECYND